MKPTSKQARRAELDREFEKGTMQATEYRQRLDDIRLAPDVEPVAPDQPNVFATVAAVRASLKNVAGVVGPLKERIQMLEKKLQMLEAQPGLTQVVNDLVSALNRPLQAIYDSTGRVVGAQRVHRLDS